MLKDKTKIFLLFSIVLITLVGISAVAAVDADDSSATTIEDASSSTAAIQANVDTKYDNNKNIIQKDVTQTTSTEKDVADKADVTSNKTVEKTTDKTLKGVNPTISFTIPTESVNQGSEVTVTATISDLNDYEEMEGTLGLEYWDDTWETSQDYFIEFTQDSTNPISLTVTINEAGTYRAYVEINEWIDEDYETYTKTSDQFEVLPSTSDVPTITIDAPETANVGENIEVTWTFTVPESYAQYNPHYQWRITDPDGESVSVADQSMTTNQVVIPQTISSAIAGEYEIYGEIESLGAPEALVTETKYITVTQSSEKIDAIVFVEPDDEYTIGESSIISGTVEADADDLSQGTVNIVITYSDSTTVELTATTDEDGYFDAEFTPNVLGTASVTATLVADDKFNEAVSNAENFEVTGSVPVITVDVLDPNDGLLVGQPVTITGTYTENGVGKDDVTVTLNINGEDLAQTATTENGGKFTFTYTPETPGYYDYYAYTDENTKSTTESFGVDPLGTTITLNVPEQEIYVDDEVTIEGTLTDENNNPVAGQSLTVTINDVPINEAVQTDTDGKFSFTFTQSEADDYTINVIFDGTELYAESELNPEVTVTVLDKIETIVWIDGTLDDGNYITEGLTGSVSLMDANDMEGIPDATITITAVYAGHEDEPQTFTVTTDENGDALINEEAKYVGEVTVTATFEAFDKYAGDDDQATVTIITAPTSINLDGVEATCTDKVVVDGLLEVTVNHAGDTEGLAGQTVTISVAFDDATIAPVEVPTEDDGSFHAEIATNGNYGQATITVNYAGVEDLYDPASETATTNVVKSTILFITGDTTQLSEGLQGSGFLQVNDEAATGVTGASNKRNPLTAPAADETGIAGATVTITAVYPGHEDAPQTFDVTTEDDGSFSFTEDIPFDDLTLPASVALSAEFAGDSQYDAATATADEPAVITEDEPKVTFIDISGVDDTTEGDIIVPGFLEYVVDEDEGTTAALAGKPVTVVAKIGDEIIGQATVTTEEDGSFTATIPSNNNYGLVDITATFAGDEDYLTDSDIAQTTILMPTDLFITADDGTVREGFEVSGYLTKGVDEEDFAGATINVEVTYNDGTTAEATATTADDGTFNVKFENPVEGPVTVVATFEQTSEYAGSEATDEATITNPKLELTIEYPIDDYYYYDEVIPVEAYLYEEDGDTLASGEIPVTITVTYTDVADPVVVDTTAIDGAINAVIPAKDAKGPATVTITTTETDDYLSASEDFGTEIIAKSTAKITVEAADAILPDSILVTGTLTNVTDSANPVAIPYVPVTITIDNRDDIYTTETDENGEFSYEIPTTEEDLGDRTVTVTFEDVDYETATDDDVATVTQRSDVDIFFELDDEYEVGDEISINGFVTNADDDEAVADLELTLTINDEVIGTTTTNADGEFEFTYPATVAGPLTVTVSSQQTDDYNEASASDDTVVVAKVYDTSIYFNTEDTIDSPEELPLQGYVVYIDDDDEEQALANAPLTITVTIDGEVVDTIQTTTDDEGHFDAVFDTTDYVGTATIVVSYAGADNYTEATASDETTITNKALSNMILAVDTPYYLGVESTIDGSLFDDETDDAIAGADITVTVTYDDDSTETFTAVTESDGSFTIPFTPTKLGDITISAVFDGNDDYKATSAEEPSTVEKQLVDSVIDYYPEQDEIFLGDDLIIDALLHADDDDETPIANAVVKVKVTINDQVVIDDQNTTDANGRLSYVFTPETEGTAVVELTFEGNDDYTESEADGDVLIKPARKDVTIIIPVDDKYPVNEALEIPVNVFDEDDEAVVNQEVTVVIKFSDDSEVTLSNVTDENGDLNITVPQEQLVVGPVSIVATIEDSELYNDAEETATTEIVPVETAIDYIPETPIYSGETLVVDAILHTVDDDESPICGEDVIVKITLGNEVLVTQTVPSDLDEGRIYYEFDTTGYEGTAVVELIYEGNNYFNATTATAEVEIKPARTQPIILLEPDEKYQANAPVELSGLVYADDDDETPISGATVNVVVTFNDDSTVELSGETDDEGYFTVTIPQENLVVGPVTITATIEENDTYNESTTDAATEIVPVETAIDFIPETPIYSGETLVVDAILHTVDDDESPICGEDVIVKITLGNEVLVTQTVPSDLDEGRIYYEFDTTGYEGTAVVELIYEGNNYFNATTATAEVEIKPARTQPIILLEPDEKYQANAPVELSGLVYADDDDETPISGATVNVVVTFNDDSTVELSGETDDEGYFTVTIPQENLVVGPVTITATIEENDTYNESTTDAETEIVPAETMIDFELDDTVVSGDELVIDAYLHMNDDDETPIAGATVDVYLTIGDATIHKPVETTADGNIATSFETTGLVGDAIVVIEYIDGVTYDSASATQEVEILPPRLDVIIALDPDDTYPNTDDVELSGEVFVDNDDSTPAAGAIVNVVVTFSDDSTVELSNVTAEDGSFTIVIPKDKLVVGPVTIVATIEENDTYSEATTDATTEIVEETVDTFIDLELDSPIESGDTLIISAILHEEDDDDAVICGEPVIVKITLENELLTEVTVNSDLTDGNIYYEYDTTGKVGTAVVELIYEGNNHYNGYTATDEVLITAPKELTAIAVDVDDTYVLGSEIEINGLLYVDDDEQAPIAGEDVTVTIKFADGLTVSRTNVTDDEGSFTVTFPANVEGIATITAEFAGNDAYKESSDETTTEIIAKEQKSLQIIYEPDTPLDNGEPIEINAEVGYYDEDDEFVPVSDIEVHVKVTLPNGTEIEENITPIEGVISFTVETDGLDGEATVELSFEGNEDYTAAEADGTVELLPPEEVPTDTVLHVMISGDPTDIENDTVLDAPATIVIEGKLLDSEGNVIPVEGLWINYTIVVVYADGSNDTIEGQTNVDEETGDWMLDDLEVDNAATVNVTVFFEGNGTYLASDVEERHFSVGGLEPILVIDVDPNPAELGDEVTVTARLINNVTGKPITDGYINIIVEDSEGEQVAIIAGEAPEGVLELTFTPESLGEYTVTVDEDEYLLSEETTLEVIKPEVTTELVDVSIPDELYEGKEADITGQLVDDEGTGLADQPITVTVTNEDGYEEVFEGLTDDEGNFVIPINPDTIGPVTVTVSYPGNETEDVVYKPASESEDAEIVSVEYDVTLDELEPVYDYNTTVNITGTVTSSYDPLDIDEITLTINGEEVTVPVDDEGKFKYEFPGTTAGDYEVVAIVNDDTKSEPQTFTIDKFLVEVTAEGPTETVFIGDDDAPITGTLVDMETKAPIADAPISIIVNGEEAGQTTTDSEGKFTYDVADKLVNGTNNITVVAVATDNYDEDSVDLTVDAILRQNLTIEIIKPSGDIKINDTVTVVIITSDNGTIVKVDALNYTFNDKPTEELPITGTHGEYTVTSDVNGTFTLNVSRAQDDYYNYAENTTTITFRNLNTAIESNDNSIQEAKVFDEVELSVNVVDENGVPVGKGTVEFTYDGKVIGTADVTDGTATITTVFNDSGRKDVTVKFTSEDTYADSTSDYTVVAIIDEATTNLTVDPIDEIEVGKPTNVTGKVTDEEGNPLAGVPVSVKVGDKVVNGTTGDDGKFSIPVTPEDANVDEVTVSVPANEGYAPAEETIPVDVEKQDANITVDPVNKLEAGKETPVTGKVTDENGNPVANAPVTVKVGDQTYTGTTDDDGKFSIPVTPEKSGNTPVDVSVGETDNTKPANKTTTANVGKQDANLTVDPIKNAEAGKPTNVTGKVTDEDGNPVAGAPVTVKVGDKTYTGNTGEDGKFTIPVTPETSGSQPVQVSVGQTATTKPANKTSTANVGQQDAKATVDPITDAKVGKEVPVTGKVTDEQGNPVAGAPVNVTVDGKTYTGTTDEDGNYNIPVTPTKAGSLPVNVNVGATNQTKAAKANTTAKVTKQDPTVTVNPINGAEAGKSVPVTGSVTDEEGKPVANAPVTVKVGDKTYTGTTDKDGKFSIPVTPTKSGTLPVNVNVGATNNTNAAKANTTAKVTKQDPTVTVDPVTGAEVGKSVPVTGSVTDEEGKPVANAPVTVKVGDKTYTGTTDKDGKFSIPVTPTTAGDNPVTVTVPATNTTNAKTVKDSITVSKVATTLTVSAPKTVTVGDTYTINGTLKGADNKAIANAKVSINVDGKVLTATTNSAGIFNVTSTAADVGKEEVTAVFAGDAKYDASNVANATVTVNKLGTKTTVAKVTGKALNNVTITATVNDAKGNAVKSGAVYFTDSNNNVLGLANVTNGKASIVTSYPEQFNGTIKAQFLGSDNYTASTGSVKANITKQNVVIKADPITGQMNDNVTIKATITDENGNPVQSGNVVFKINGQTVKDASGNQLKVRVVDGTVTAEVNATQAWKGNSTLTIRYLGDNTYNASENTTKANIAPRKAQVVLITDKIARGGDQIVLTAFVTDNGEAVNGGQVIFKVNGETIKDASGKAIIANVVNGTASIVYDIRPGMSAKDLNMSVVLSNKLYDRTENSTILTIVRSDVYFNTSIVHAKDGKAHIKATLRDAKGELCVYNTDIALKVGGKTQLSVAKNGIVDCEIDTSFLKPGVYELYYVAGLNNRYNEVRMTNALIVE